jgi:hypothetical protein
MPTLHLSRVETFAIVKYLGSSSPWETSSIISRMCTTQQVVVTLFLEPAMEGHHESRREIVYVAHLWGRAGQVQLRDMIGVGRHFLGLGK